jgi:hypothetical protein
MTDTENDSFNMLDLSPMEDESFEASQMQPASGVQVLMSDLSSAQINCLDPYRYVFCVLFMYVQFI